MPRLALGWGSSVRSSVLLPAMTPNSGRPDVESPATPRLRRTGPAPTPSSVTHRASPVAGWACLAAVTSGPLPAADMGLGPPPSCVLRALRGFVLHLIQI